MFSFSMLNGLFDPVLNWFNALLYYVNVILYYIIVGGIGKICDMCQALFRKFAGLDGMSLNGEEGDIVMQFINNGRVQQVFWAMVILAVVLIFITSFVAIIKTEFDKNGNNNKRKVIGSALRGIVNFLIVPVVSIFGVIVGNALLKTLDGALSSSGQQTLISNQMFVAGAYNANRVRIYEGTGENNVGYAKDSMAYYITHDHYGDFGIFTDDTTGVVMQTAADKIDDAFANNLTITLSDLGDEKSRTLVYANGPNQDYIYTYVNVFPLGVYPDFGYALPNEDVGGNKTWLVTGDTITFSIYNIGLVNYYYNMSMGSFDYLITAIGLIFAAYVFITTCLGLIKRLFMIVTLFIISPPICAMYPLDDGAALGKWRKEFIAQALSAYAVVVILNIFILLLPLFTQIQIITAGDGHWGGLINYFARVLIVIGALTFFKDATKTVGDLIGAGNAFGDGEAKSKDFQTNMRRVAAVGSTALGLTGKAIDAVGKLQDPNGDVNDDKNSMNKDQEVTQKDAENNAIKEQQDADNNGGTGDNGGAIPPNSTGEGNNGLNKEETEEEKKQQEEEKKQQDTTEKGKGITPPNQNKNKPKSKWGVGGTIGAVATGVLAPGFAAVYWANKGIKALGNTKFGRFMGAGFKTIGNVIGTTFKNIGKLSGDKFSVDEIANSYNDVLVKPDYTGINEKPKPKEKPKEEDAKEDEKFKIKKEIEELTEKRKELEPRTLELYWKQNYPDISPTIRKKNQQAAVEKAKQLSAEIEELKKKLESK